MPIKGIIITIIGAFFTFIGKSGMDQARLESWSNIWVNEWQSNDYYMYLGIMFFGIILLIVGIVLIVKKLKKSN